MKDSFLNIARAAEKESHTGYGDYAVFGGFSAFVEKTLADDDSDDALLLKGTCRHYGDSNLLTRKNIIAFVLRVVAEIAEKEGAEKGSEKTAKPEKKKKEEKTESAEERIPAVVPASAHCVIFCILPAVKFFLYQVECVSIDDRRMRVLHIVDRRFFAVVLRPLL